MPALPDGGRQECLSGLDGHAVHARGSVTDPVGPSDAPRRVLRGGRWRDGARALRSACRMSLLPDAAMHDLGFRILLVREAW